MATLQEALEANQNLDMSRYTATTPLPALNPYGNSLEPVFNKYLRCPLPPVNALPDSLRQFYRGGDIPQMRLINLPNTVFGNGGTVINKTTVVSSTASGAVSTGTAQTAQLTVSLDAPNTIPGQDVLNTVQIAKEFSITQVAVSDAARVRMYSTQSAQNVDLPRGQTPPDSSIQHGVILDLWLDTPGNFSWIMSPIAVGSNQDDPQSKTVYVTVTNLSATVQDIMTTFTYVIGES